MSPLVNDANLPALLRTHRIVPVLTVDSVDSALALSRALVAGGLPMLEITLRTPCALDSVARVSAEVAGAIVGVGTVVDAAQFAQARARGARFAVSPGSTRELVAAAQAAGIAYLPGAATVSEAMALRSLGVRLQKFFPAEVAGGTAALAAIATVLQDVQFCPTGGIDAQRLENYLALPNVIAVGGSWMVPRALVAARDWAGITRLAAEAVALVAAHPAGTRDPLQ